MLCTGICLSIILVHKTLKLDNSCDCIFGFVGYGLRIHSFVEFCSYRHTCSFDGLDATK